MRIPESLARFLTRLTGNLFIVLAWSFAAGTILVATRLLRPTAFAFLLPLTLAAVLVWTLLDPPSNTTARLRSLLQKRRYERAFRLAASSQQLDLLDLLLLKDLHLPSELLRPQIRAAFTELRVLHQSLQDPANRFVDPGLRTAMRDRSTHARHALWKLCENLEVVASQKVLFADDHPKVQRIARLVGDLAQSTGQVRVKLAELTLAPGHAELEEARIAIDQIRRQSEALLEFESLAGF